MTDHSLDLQFAVEVFMTLDSMSFGQHGIGGCLPRDFETIDELESQRFLGKCHFGRNNLVESIGLLDITPPEFGISVRDKSGLTKKLPNGFNGLVSCSKNDFSHAALFVNHGNAAELAVHLPTNIFDKMPTHSCIAIFRLITSINENKRLFDILRPSYKGVLNEIDIKGEGDLDLSLTHKCQFQLDYKLRGAWYFRVQLAGFDFRDFETFSSSYS